MENIKDEFRKDFCERCGSQRCSGQDDELEYCERFKNLIDNLEKTSVKNHKMGPKSKLPSKYYEEIQTKRDMDETIFMIGPVMVPDKVDDKLEYEIIDGYEFDKVENNKIILKPIKPKYPKTYAECKEMMSENTHYGFSVFTTLQNLIICRDAYWKIAGEQMGLGKPWESPLPSLFETVYCIRRKNNEIIKGAYRGGKSEILEFPTEEMRDAFYENFKKEIEQCKELL